MHMRHGEKSESSSEIPPSELYSDANLFIRQLSRLVDEHELRRIFSPYGEILSAAVMRNIHTGENLGTAFVRYATTEQARAALKDCHGRFLYGRTISVHWARKQHDDAPVGEARRKIFKLFVRNIPLDVTAEDLARLFAYFGPVGNVTLHKDTASTGDKRLERRIAFVEYLLEGVAEKAAETIHNTRPFPSSGSIPLMVKLAEDLPSRSRRQTAALVDSFRKAVVVNSLRSQWHQRAADFYASPPSLSPPQHHHYHHHGYVAYPSSKFPTWSLSPHFSSSLKSLGQPKSLAYFENFANAHPYQHLIPSLSSVTTPIKSEITHCEVRQRRFLASGVSSWCPMNVPSQQTLNSLRTIPFALPEKNGCPACSFYASRNVAANSLPDLCCSPLQENVLTPAMMQPPQATSSASRRSSSSCRGAANDEESSGGYPVAAMETRDSTKRGTRYTHNPYGMRPHELILGPVAPVRVV